MGVNVYSFQMNSMWSRSSLVYAVGISHFWAPSVHLADHNSLHGHALEMSPLPDAAVDDAVAVFWHTLCLEHSIGNPSSCTALRRKRAQYCRLAFLEMYSRPRNKTLVQTQVLRPNFTESIFACAFDRKPEAQTALSLDVKSHHTIRSHKFVCPIPKHPPSASTQPAAASL